MIAAACSRAFNRAQVHDPEFARLRAAARSTLACLLTAGLGVAWALQHHDTPTLAVPGALFGMIAPLFLREARVSGWLVSLLILYFCAFASFAGAAEVASQPALRVTGSLLVVFVGMLCQTLGARAVGAALITLVCFYLGLYLHPSHARLMQMLVVMTIAPLIVVFVGRVVIPVERVGAPLPSFMQALPHSVAAAKAWTGAAMRYLADLIVSGRPTGRLTWQPLATMFAHRLHRLAWRPALVATLAALLAMLAGGELSEDRSMWAVITTFVVFLGTTSHQGTRTRVMKRIAGTLTGAAASVLVVTVCGQEPWVLVAAMALSVFGWAYYILHAYARGVFFITMLVGLVYGQLGFAIMPLAKLRIEEVFAGCLISLAVAVLLMPSANARAVAVLERE
ncbi:FUSC family protein [Paraburkholderia silvatlantica]|uniref:Fusaric acid resistance family protein n=1 Tax=Paraburkholderia silvatlantica TaxID=321895 RepID=A0A2U0ZGB4_9BURK|nr:FUSC family protein [Paraburkholderia silvatlantica]MBB2930431.1 hypothetical protein [Paraburkholderia silvatlantica]PVY17916.1 fusaric acid resistance family protein [Paraburkholderia silvatlantica]PXW23836.1 fusaric acid resistance family protein [Paraburkholderia silvatlantica]PYE12412.1 fusaric acid resistance family protein [Paraburkholderia silvatlantica]TDQ73316.1 fusaric acid resistance family protein [Paraburkholderia silvatlantica]